VEGFIKVSVGCHIFAAASTIYDVGLTSADMQQRGCRAFLHMLIHHQ
jgi:hypothetical protein